jgi:hypothetical protein
VLWAIASYSVIAPIFSYVGLVQLFANTPFAQRFPLYAHYFAYFVPGVCLAAGLTLFLRSKLAVALYAGVFSGPTRLPRNHVPAVLGSICLTQLLRHLS